MAVLVRCLYGLNELEVAGAPRDGALPATWPCRAFRPGRGIGKTGGWLRRANGRSMDGKRSYLDILNEGRLRRSSSSLDELNRSLQELELRLHRHDERSGTTAPAQRGADSAAEAERSLPPADQRTPLEALRHDLQAQMDKAPSLPGSRLLPEAARRAIAPETPFGRGETRQTERFQVGLTEIKDALGALAREETVRSVNARWADFDRRFGDLESRIEATAGQPAADREAFSLLRARVEEISERLGSFPDSTSLRALEDKMRQLAAVVDTFSRQEDRRGTAAMAQIEERLDEISRAIVASAAVPPSLDPQPFERIEARISSLARQIEELSEAAQQTALVERVTSLSDRIDALAARSALPDEAVEHLLQQVAMIVERLDQPSAAPISDSLLQGIEERFDLLAHIFDQRHEDAIAQGRALFGDLEQRLEAIAERIEAPQAVADNSAIDALAQRIELMTLRLDQAPPAGGLEPDLVRNLEAHVTALSHQLAQAGPTGAERDSIGPRLHELERSVRDHREGMAEAVRQAAEQAVRALAEHQPAGAGEDLTAELKAIESLTRRSEERNTKTFEAIHDTLLKIVERLASMERTKAVADGEGRRTVAHAPSIAAPDAAERAEPAANPAAAARTPAEAAAAAAVAAMQGGDHETQPKSGLRSLLGLGRRRVAESDGRDLGGDLGQVQAEPDAPSLDLEPPLDPRLANIPLPPGSGTPDLSAILKRVRDERLLPGRPLDTDAARSDFFAAAKRAAQAAAAEADIAKRAAQGEAGSKGLRFGGLFRARRMALMLSAAGVLVALGGMQLGKALLAGDPAAVVATPSVAPAAPAVVPVRGPKPAATAGRRAAGPPKRPRGGGDRRRADPTRRRPAARRPGQQAGGAAAGTAPVAEGRPPASTPTCRHRRKRRPVRLGGSRAGRRRLGSGRRGTARLARGRRSRRPEGAVRGRLPLCRRARHQGRMKAAAKWYEKAAELGLAPAEYRIGNFYEKGLGVDRDIAKAKTWYQMAAEQGNASAMHNLAVLFAMGADGAADNESAARWFPRRPSSASRTASSTSASSPPKASACRRTSRNPTNGSRWSPRPATTTPPPSATRSPMRCGPSSSSGRAAAIELWKAKPVNPETNTVDIPECMARKRRQDGQRRHEEGGPQHPADPQQERLRRRLRRRGDGRTRPRTPSWRSRKTTA